MKIKHFYTLLFLTITAVITFAAFSVQNMQNTGEVENNKSRIIFSHKIHAEITDCNGCHTKAGDAKTMKDQLLPKMEDCATCHDVENTDECNKCHYESVQEPLIQKKSQIIFNHSFHVGNKVECTYCHKGMENVDYAFESAGSVPSMETCSTCHGEKKSASLACESCHITTVNLLPQSHNVVDFKKRHKFLAEKPNADCVMCHDNNACDLYYLGIAPTNHKSPNFTTFGLGSGGGEHATLARRDIERCASCHESDGADPVCITCHVDNLPGKGNNLKTHPTGFMKNEHGLWHDTDGAVCYTCHIGASSNGIPGVGFCGYCHGSSVD